MRGGGGGQPKLKILPGRGVRKEGISEFFPWYYVDGSFEKNLLWAERRQIDFYRKAKLNHLQFREQLLLQDRTFWTKLRLTHLPGIFFNKYHNIQGENHKGTFFRVQMTPKQKIIKKTACEMFCLENCSSLFGR